MAYKIVLTTDRTMASTYNRNMFFGFSACLPQGVLPDWFYYPVFCPSAPADERGALVYASCGIRKIEAALLKNGFQRDELIVAHPDHLEKLVTSETKILCISANDPLGIGPATSTFVELWGGEGRMAIKLRELLTKTRAIQKYKPKVVLGGPGAWQLAIHPEKRTELGIDCVVMGDGDITAPELFREILRGEPVEPVIQGKIAEDEDISDLAGATIVGLVEATRGCARSCAFCVPSIKKVRSRPLQNILNDVQMNVVHGNNGIILHGEDILLYQSDGLMVNSAAVIELFDRVEHFPGVKWVTASHASFSSALSSPETIRGIAEVLELGTEKHPTKALQIGIETGSPKLIARHMKGKVYPFKPEDWQRVVHDGAQLLHENHWVYAATLIMGLPGEEQEDVQLTIDLVKKLRPFKGMIVPLFFTPMETTRLEYATPFHKTDLTPLHYELLAACWNHNLDWIPELWSTYGRDNNPLLKTVINALIRYGTGPIRRRMLRNARKHGATV
ncbi:B12-binding domain-containing radical SAM protein [candidate division KSB1 bacterium]|nr:B12-binding domain-containing radical SAM protein [candidate division KSB1 bacterium]